MSQCKFCQLPIDWASKDGRYRPINLDGSAHHCSPEERRAAWVKNHGPMIRRKRILDAEFRRALRKP